MLSGSCIFPAKSMHEYNMNINLIHSFSRVKKQCVNTQAEAGYTNNFLYISILV